MIENTSHLDKKSSFAVNRAIRKKQKVWILICLSVLILVFISFRFYRDYPDSSMGLALFIVALLLPLLMLLANRWGFEMLQKSDKRSPNGSTVQYEFREEEFFTHTKTEMVDSSETYRYSAVFQAYDTPDFLVLMVNLQIGHIVEKRGFTSGSAEELVALLRKNGVKVY